MGASGHPHYKHRQARGKWKQRSLGTDEPSGRYKKQKEMGRTNLRGRQIHMIGAANVKDLRSTVESYESM